MNSKIDQFFSHILFESGNVTITVLSVFLILLVLLTVILSSWFLRRYLIKTKSKKGRALGYARKLFMLINLIIWTLGAMGILVILNVPFLSVLEYPLIDTKNISLKPFHFFVAAFVIIGTRILLMGLEKVFGFDKVSSSLDITKRKNVFKVFSYLLWVIAFLVILNLVGLKLTVFLGAGAALLVGIGFGLQQIFADLISGLFLLFEGNLREDDVVELNNGTVGKVTYIGSRTSKVKTRDNVVLIVPNSHFISQEVINWSHIETQTRFNVDVGVAYGSDVQLVKRVLLECADDHPDLAQSPRPFVRFQDFGDSSLDFSVYFWTSRSFEVENIKSDMRFTIEEKFRANNIQIPFPQRDVHMKS